MIVRTLAFFLRDVESPWKASNRRMVCSNIIFTDSMVAELRTQQRDKRMNKGDLVVFLCFQVRKRWRWFRW